MLLTKLTHDLRQGETKAEQAGLILGLLIEREKIPSYKRGNDDEVRQILGDELANQKLSKADIKQATDDLIDYISDETSVPHHMAVWALNKTYDERVTPHLITLFNRSVKNLDQEPLAYEALLGIINIGIPSSVYRDRSLAVIRTASELGHGRVKEQASEYLKLYQSFER